MLETRQMRNHLTALCVSVQLVVFAAKGMTANGLLQCLQGNLISVITKRVRARRGRNKVDEYRMLVFFFE